MSAPRGVARLHEVRALYERGRYADAYAELERLIDRAPGLAEPYLFIADLMAGHEPAFERACRSFADANADGRPFADYRIRPQTYFPEAQRSGRARQPARRPAGPPVWTTGFRGLISAGAVIAVGLTIFFGFDFEHRAPEPGRRASGPPTHASAGTPSSSGQPARFPGLVRTAHGRAAAKQRPACAAFAEYGLAEWFGATTTKAPARPRCQLDDDGRAFVGFP